jgi:uncharacterized membrane protein YeaQ/YmgE (transglycosylase-associated protein family)
MTVTELIVYLIIAAVVSIIAERIVGSGPWGLIGNIIVGVIGIWLMLNVLHFVIPGDPVVAGVPILTAILGAMIVDIIVSLLVRGTGPRRSWRRRSL